MVDLEISDFRWLKNFNLEKIRIKNIDLLTKIILR